MAAVKDRPFLREALRALALLAGGSMSEADAIRRTSTALRAAVRDFERRGRERIAELFNDRRLLAEVLAEAIDADSFEVTRRDFDASAFAGRAKTIIKARKDAAMSAAFAAQRAAELAAAIRLLPTGSENAAAIRAAHRALVDANEAAAREANKQAWRAWDHAGEDE